MDALQKHLKMGTDISSFKAKMSEISFHLADIEIPNASADVFHDSENESLFLRNLFKRLIKSKREDPLKSWPSYDVPHLETWFFHWVENEAQNMSPAECCETYKQLKKNLEKTGVSIFFEKRTIDQINREVRKHNDEIYDTNMQTSKSRLKELHLQLHLIQTSLRQVTGRMRLLETSWLSMPTSDYSNQADLPQDRKFETQSTLLPHRYSIRCHSAGGSSSSQSCSLEPMDIDNSSNKKKQSSPFFFPPNDSGFGENVSVLPLDRTEVWRWEPKSKEIDTDDQKVMDLDLPALSTRVYGSCPPSHHAPLPDLSKEEQRITSPEQNPGGKCIGQKSHYQFELRGLNLLPRPTQHAAKYNMQQSYQTRLTRQGCPPFHSFGVQNERTESGESSDCDLPDLIPIARAESSESLNEKDVKVTKQSRPSQQKALRDAAMNRQASEIESSVASKIELSPREKAAADEVLSCYSVALRKRPGLTVESETSSHLQKRTEEESSVADMCARAGSNCEKRNDAGITSFSIPDTRRIQPVLSLITKTSSNYRKETGEGSKPYDGPSTNVPFTHPRPLSEFFPELESTLKTESEAGAASEALPEPTQLPTTLNGTMRALVVRLSRVSAENKELKIRNTDLLKQKDNFKDGNDALMIQFKKMRVEKDSSRLQSAITESNLARFQDFYNETRQIVPANDKKHVTPLEYPLTVNSFNPILSYLRHREDHTQQGTGQAAAAAPSSIVSRGPLGSSSKNKAENALRLADFRQPTLKLPSLMTRDGLTPGAPHKGSSVRSETSAGNRAHTSHVEDKQLTNISDKKEVLRGEVKGRNMAVEDPQLTAMLNEAKERRRMEVMDSNMEALGESWDSFDESDLYSH